jgi:anti-anti-sigma factor
MDIQVSTAQGRIPVTVLKLKGELDSSTSQQFETRANEAIHSGARNLLIDLSNVPFVSSAGLRAIHRIFNVLHNEAEQDVLRKEMMSGYAKSPHLKLSGLNDNVARVFSMAGFDMYLDSYKDTQSALTAF